MSKNYLDHRFERIQGLSLRSWEKADERPDHAVCENVVVDCGWGRLIFGQTFNDSGKILDILRQEEKGRRDIAFYVRDPHVIISLGPQEIFIDPSHSYRLWLDRYTARQGHARGFHIRRANKLQDAQGMQRVCKQCRMIPATPSFIQQQKKSRVLTYLVAIDKTTGDTIGCVTGVDHKEAFCDPENGSSLWALAVSHQTNFPGVGEALVRRLAEHYQARGRSYMDLSVMHNNQQAISLYKKLGFQRVPVFAVKCKNPINEPLFIADPPEKMLNPYAKIIIDEARRRGIGVEVIDAESGYFSLSLGGRSIVCRESLSELTSAIAMSRCDDKAVTSRLLSQAGLRVPAQMQAASEEENLRFLQNYQRVVIKPARGEQGAGISVDIRTADELEMAIRKAKKISNPVLLEEFVEGIDLRIVVIDYQVVAAAVRKPPVIKGTGNHTIAQLIAIQSRRRSAATAGESTIPMDNETKRCIETVGYELDSVLPEGEKLMVRKTANLHTGGTIHDVTDAISPSMKEAAEKAARTLDIPVTGLDFLVPSLEGDKYVIVEANERPGLANHEPQPTAERFVDLLFPQSAVMYNGSAGVQAP